MRSCVFICIVILLIISLAALCAGRGMFEVTPEYTISWEINGDEITVHTVVHSLCWVGMGLHEYGSSDSGMQNGDFIVAIFNDSTGELLSVTDRHAPPNSGSGQTQPVDDTSLGGEDNILSYYGYQDQNFNLTTFQWTRKLNTGDPWDWEIMANDTMSLVWAHGTGNEFEYHGQSNRGAFSLNFGTGAASRVPSRAPALALYHGTLMIVSFVFCMTFGIFVARYIKQYWWWFPLHIMIQLLGVILASTGFGIAIYMTQGAHFSSVHSKFGLSVISLAILTPIVGALAHFLWDPKRPRVPVWPDMFHWWCGRLTVLLAFVTIILGMLLYQVAYPLIYMFGALAFLLIATYYSIEVFRLVGKYSRSKVDPEKERLVIKRAEQSVFN